MDDNFNDYARKSMASARQHAERRHHDFIGTEHLLLSILDDGAGPAVSALKKLGVDPDTMRRELENSIIIGETPIEIGKYPFTPRAKKVLDFAIEEAATMNHDCVGTEHVLLGLLREERGIAAQVLAKFGLNPDRVRCIILSFSDDVPKLGKPAQAVPPELEPRISQRMRAFGTLTPRARNAMRFAREKAEEVNHEYIGVGTEHILLGLLKVDAGVAITALKNLDVDLSRVRREVELRMKHALDVVTITVGELPLSPHSKKVFELAVAEARMLGHDYIGTEHILLGLLSERDCIAGQALAQLGLKIGYVRSEIIRVLDVQPELSSPLQSGFQDDPAATPDVEHKLILKAAINEARAVRARTLRSEHFLIALLAYRDGAAAKLLHKHGLDIDAVRVELRTILREKK